MDTKTSSVQKKKYPCPDCDFCQFCSETRCNMCRPSVSKKHKKNKNSATKCECRTMPENKKD